MTLYFVAVAAAFDKAQEDIFRLRRGAEMNFRCLHAQNGACPRVAALAVGYHLALVNHRDFVTLFQVQLFGGGGNVGVVVPVVLLLPGGQAAVKPGVK